MFNREQNVDQKGWGVLVLAVVCALSSISFAASSISSALYAYAHIALVAGAVVCAVFGVVMLSDGGKKK